MWCLCGECLSMRLCGVIIVACSHELPVLVHYALFMVLIQFFIYFEDLGIASLALPLITRCVFLCCPFKHFFFAFCLKLVPL